MYGNSFLELEHTITCSPGGNKIFHKPYRGLLELNQATDSLTICAGFIVLVYKFTPWNNNIWKWEEVLPDYQGRKYFYEYASKYIE